MRACGRGALGRPHCAAQDLPVLTLQLHGVQGCEMSAAPKPRKQPKPKPVDPREESYYRWMGQRIARVRQHRKLTQQQLADKSGYTVASICSIEKGRQRTPLFELFRIGETLGLIDPRVLLPYPALDPALVDGHIVEASVIDDTVDLEVALNGPDLIVAEAAFSSAADLAEENAAIAHELGLGAPDGWRVAIDDGGAVSIEDASSGEAKPEMASNESEKQEEVVPRPLVLNVPHCSEIGIPHNHAECMTVEELAEVLYGQKCRLCGGPLVTRMDQEFQIHSEKCRKAETDAKRRENGTAPASYEGQHFYDTDAPGSPLVASTGRVTVGGASVSLDDPRIIPTPNPHKPEETAFQAGQYVWATREDAAGYLAALDTGRAGSYASGEEGLRILADDDPDVRRATGSESCGICSASIDPDAAILEVKGAGGMSTDVGPCCQQFYV